MLTIVGQQQQQQAAKGSCNASRMFEALSLSKTTEGQKQALVSLQKRQKAISFAGVGSGSDYLESGHVTGK